MNLLKPFIKKHLYVRLAKTGSTSLNQVLDNKTVTLTPSLKARRKFTDYNYDYRFTIIRNPFDAGGYSLAEMTQAINILPNLYTRLAQISLFAFEGVTQRSVIIEQMEGVLNIKCFFWIIKCAGANG